MKTFANLQEILPATPSLPWDSAVFVDVAAWRADPLAAPLTLLEGDDELEDLVDMKCHLPRIAVERGLRQMLETQTFQDVIAFERRRNPHATPRDYAFALDHYREMDDFFDPEPR